jgi:hypothetical protein
MREATKKSPGIPPGPNVTHEKKALPIPIKCSSVVTFYVMNAA